MRLTFALLPALLLGTSACNKPAPAPAKPGPAAAPVASAVPEESKAPEAPPAPEAPKAPEAEAPKPVEAEAPKPVEAEAPKPAAVDPGAAAAVVPAAGTQHFGEAFQMTEAATPVDTLFAKPDEFNGKTVKVAANITKVCKKKGCWFVLEGESGDGQFIRVTMKGYSFFVPLDADGKKAVVEGVFKKVDVPEAARKHLAEDGKEDPNAIKGSAMELTLVANGVDIQG